MLDALKRFGNGQKEQKERTRLSQAEDLEQVLAAAREEREALTALLDRAKADLPRVSRAGTTVSKLADRIESIHARLEDATTRLSATEASAARADALTSSVATMAASISSANDAAQRLLAPDGELQKQRDVVQQLAAQSLQSRAVLETLTEERKSLDQLRNDLRTAMQDVATSREQLAATSTAVDTVRATAAAALKDEERVRDLARETREDAAAAAAVVRDVDQKLQAFSKLQDAAQAFEQKLTALNALAEHVTQKAKVLEGQKRTIEHALVESHRVGEMVSAMDTHIARLTDSGQKAARVEETVERVDRLVRASEQQVEDMLRTREAIDGDLGRLDRDRTTLIEFVRQHEDRIAAERRALDANQARVTTLGDSVAELERAQDALVTRETDITTATDRLAALGQQIGSFEERSRGFEEKLAVFTALREDMLRADEMSRRLTWQMESLKSARQDLDELRADIQTFYREQAGASQMLDRLAADRTSLEAFVSRVGAFSAQLPDIDARINAIRGKLSGVDEDTQKAANLVAIADDLDRQMTRLGGHQQFVERLEARLNGLNVMTLDVDRKVDDQLQRRGEIESLRSLCDSVSLQVTDVRQKLEGVSQAQTKLLPITSDIAALKTDVDRANARMADALRGQAEITTQETRVADMLERVRSLNGESAERVQQVEQLTASLGRSETLKDEMIRELAVVQGRQREVAGQTETVEAHAKQIDVTLRQLEQRKDQLVFAEKRIDGFDARLDQMATLTDVVDRRIKDLEAKEETVHAIRREIDGLREASAASKADLDHVESHRADLVSLRAMVDELLATAQAADERVAEIHAKRRLVDEVHLKVNVITAMLDDVKVNLETVGEQRTVIAHALTDLASLEQMVRQAQSTLQSLRTERELAERIGRSIEALRSRTAVTEDRKRA